MEKMKDAMNTIGIDLYVRDTGPLKEEEFIDMMAYDNEDLSIEDLNFEIIAI